MERIEISAAQINLPEIVRQVSRDGVAVELSDQQVPLARIVPVRRVMSMIELDRALKETETLGEDAESFARDVFAARESIGELDDPLES